MNNLRPGPTLVFLCGISAIIWFHPLLETFTLATTDDRYTHIVLILPLSVALIFLDRKARSFQNQPWMPAVALLLIALVMMALSRWGNLGNSSDVRLAIEMAALVGWWIASFLLCYSLHSFRSLRFPLFFLFWMIPIPRFALDWIVEQLQQWSIVAAQSLFWIFRVPVSREGILILIPGLDLEVTPDCSSIRSSLMLVVTTMVLTHVLLKSPWRKALVIAIAIPLSVAKNGLRIFTIGMLGTRVDPGFLTGRLHRQGGIVFFLIALVIIVFLIWALRRGETRGRG